MSIRRRLSKLEEDLTPREAVIRWMKASQEFGSLLTYYCWLRNQPDEAWPLVALPRQVATETGKRARRGSAQDGGAAAQVAERNVIFLFTLLQIANVDAARRENDLKTRLMKIASDLRALACEVSARDERRRSALIKSDTPGKDQDCNADERYAALAERTCNETKRALKDAVVLGQAVEIISATYLKKQPLLFPEPASRLQLLGTVLGELETVRRQLLGTSNPESEAEFRAELVREAAGKKAAINPSPTPVDQAEAEPPVEDLARKRAEELLILAKVETLRLIGDPTRSQTLLAQYVDSGLAKATDRANR